MKHSANEDFSRSPNTGVRPVATSGFQRSVATRTFDIPLHRPFIDARENKNLAGVLASGVVSGGGEWMRRAEYRLRRRFGVRHALLTSSCSHSLEAAALVQDWGPGDEIIVPSWAFPTTASSVLRTGATVVFADSKQDDPGLDPEDVLRRLTPRTRGIVALHYGGLPCDLEALRILARDHSLTLVEDAAQAFDSKLKGAYLGTIGEIGCISFHGTKNLTCGEGGLILTNDDELARRLARIRELGTNRPDYRRGRVSSYCWQTLGSSYLPSELAAAMLCAQLEKADAILGRRRHLFANYLEAFATLEKKGQVMLPRPTQGSRGNGHLFYLRLPDAASTRRLRTALAERGIEASPHFQALDQSPMGKKIVPSGTRPCTQAMRLESTLLRLPIYPTLTAFEQESVIDGVADALCR